MGMDGASRGPRGGSVWFGGGGMGGTDVPVGKVGIGG
jgi:hypothetical protein